MAVPAAGTGNRMGGRRKPFIPLAGQPLLRHALAPFLAHPWVRSVVVALHPEDHRAPPVWLRELDPRIRIVSGGATRVHSVSTAVDALFPEVSWVMVHDGARPLVTDTIVERCARAAYSGRAALAGWPVTDTIKEVGRRGRGPLHTRALEALGGTDAASLPPKGAGSRLFARARGPLPRDG